MKARSVNLLKEMKSKVKHQIHMLIEKNIFIYGVIISTGYGVVSLQGFLIAFIGEVFV